MEINDTENRISKKINYFDEDKQMYITDVLLFGS